MLDPVTSKLWWPVLAAWLLVSSSLPLAWAQEHKIVVGPRNAELQDGAAALRAGNAEDGIRLTLAGLKNAANRDERLTGRSNLCAGYILQQRFSDALQQCDRALAEDGNYWRALANRALIHVLEGRYDQADKDLVQAEKLAPSADSVRNVRELLRDRLNPVAPIVIIDDRRAGEDENQD